MDALGAVSAARAENWGESAMTDSPQINSKPINNCGGKPLSQG